MFKKRIYLDYASLTPIDLRVLREMKKFSAPKYANPSSWYKESVDARTAMDDSRKKIADFIHALPDEIVFTSGGTEANNLAIMGAFRAFISTCGAKSSGIEKSHLIISSIEHSSIMEVAKKLENQGCEVTRLGVDNFGQISIEELKKSIKPNTFMVSIMTVNNEIGTIQPIREIAKIIRQTRNEFISVRRREQSLTMSPKGFEGETVVDERTRPNYPLFHTDAAQAALYNDLYVEKLGIDLLTLDGSKVYGPRGMGALYVRRGVPIEPIIYGGGQESGMRSGTENLPGIAGFAKALEIIEKEERQNGREGTMRKDSTIRDSKIDILRTVMIEGLKKIRPNIRINGPMEINDESRAKNIVSYSPHILNVSIPGIDNEFLVMQLDARGIACSTKSSCLRDQDESYVLRAVGANSSESVRFSFGRWTKARDVRKTLNILRKLL